MARLTLTILLLSFLLYTTSLALQVSANSECASLCMDDPEQDKSDPNVSNTKGSDIVCHDENYSSPEGQKFEQCISCLQKSTSSSSSESDLQWLLYNLRFAVTSCIFGLHNATDPISSPCTIQPSCGPLVGALQDGMDDPVESNRFSYCTAFGSTFSGSHLAPCTKCLSLSNEQKYTANFMVALRAGCTQQPQPGTLLGLDGNLFSTNLVNITTPVTTGTAAPQAQLTLSTGALVGIAVAGLVVILAIIGSIFIGWRKRKLRKERDVSSGLDKRFGHQAITMPVKGAYNDPHATQSTYHDIARNPSKPPKTRKSLWSRKSQPQTREYHHSPHSSQSTPPAYPIEMSRRPGTSLSYNPAEMGPLPTYSPPVWTPPEHTPSFRTPSPTSTTHSRTPLNWSSISPSGSSHAIATRPRGSPMIASSAQSSPIPRRSNSIANAMTSTNTTRRGRQTQDLSVGRGASEVASNSGPSISGPMITVDTRFEPDDETRKRLERERLYRQGFKPKKIQEPDSPDSEEMWPGNY